MEKVNTVDNVIKMFLITFYIFFTYEKIINYKSKKNKYGIICIVGFLIAILYEIINRYVPTLITIIVMYTGYPIIIKKVNKYEINYVAYIASCLISYIIYLLSIIITATILFIISPRREYTNPITLMMITLIFSILFFATFKIKRFKNGFNFLKNKQYSNKTGNIIIFIIGLIILIAAKLYKNKNWITGIYSVIGSLFIMFSLMIWIKSQITKTYKNRMRDRTIEMQKTEIEEQAKIMDELKTENLKLASVVHKYNKKFSALEFAMENALKSGINTEFADEISVILDETKEASKNFAKEVETNINKLPLTNNVGIDNMFKYMQEEARKKDINFNLKLNSSINPLLETIVSKDKFETLIGDHLKDAIIAVDKSSNSYKSILVTLGLVEGIYELSIYDTGIEFEIDTLLKLGKEQVTTHKEEGGSGIGFMTTFETLKKCKASLIIEEYLPETTNYTKAVIIRFDAKNQYKIYSYRAEKIKEQKRERRIIIEKLK